MGSAIALFAAVFVACCVEAVEALTVVLAIGLTRGWRGPLLGVAAGLGALAVLVGALGPALSTIPLNTLRLVVGALLLIFGLQWLRKAILRAAGRKSLHDEATIFRAQAEDAQTADRFGAGFDGYGFTLCFKAVLLEGLEVAFIVLTFGANAHRIPLAAIAALAAVIVVAAAGGAVRGPLARVPENQLKFAVGILLTSFGAFWSGEGAGAAWPGGDTALPVVIAVMTLAALAFTGALRATTRSSELSELGA
jgi:uncharacterized membrane protein